MRAFRTGSTVTQGLVIDRFPDPQLDANGQVACEVYYLVVRFEAGSGQMVLQARVGEPLYAASWRGQMLSVRYAHADPRIALLEGER